MRETEKSGNTMDSSVYSLLDNARLTQLYLQNYVKDYLGS